MDDSAHIPIEGSNNPDRRQRPRRRIPRKLSPAERAEQDRRRAERRRERCLHLLRDRERGWGCYDGFGWYDIKRCVEGEAYTPVSITRNHYDQWELAAANHYDAKVRALNVTRAALGKERVELGRLPESAYRADHAARYCAAPATCTIHPPCAGCRHADQ